MRWRVEADGVRRNRERIESLTERMEDLRPAGDAILDELVAAEERHWNSLPWPPLAKSTRDRKRRQGLPARRMHATGLLERTLTTRGTAAESHGQVARINRKSVVFGMKGSRSDIFYGRFHQLGKGVPKRVVVPKPTKLTRRRIGRVVLDHITEEAR